MNIILIILVFGVLIFVHEFGHFIAAKASKIRVNEFAIGMGPAIFSFKSKETKYALRLFPIGGFCLMGEDEDNAEDENSFNSKPIISRMIVIFAGPFFNLVLAFLFSIILVRMTGYDPAIIGYIQDNSPAQMQELMVGDEILEINGKKIYNFREISLFNAINNKGKEIEFLVKRTNGEKETIKITPKPNEMGEYKIGIGGQTFAVESMGDNIKYGILEIRYWGKATISSIGMIFSGKVGKDDVMGPIGVGEKMNEILDEVKETSESNKDVVINIILNMINWSILLSVNLAIMNLLPIPALDGGRLLFLTVEAITGKKIPKEKEAIVHLVGFVLLMALMVFVFFNDLVNLFAK